MYTNIKQGCRRDTYSTVGSFGTSKKTQRFPVTWHLRDVLAKMVRKRIINQFGSACLEHGRFPSHFTYAKV
jgi:hypothetical protein